MCFEIDMMFFMSLFIYVYTVESELAYYMKGRDWDEMIWRLTPGSFESIQNISLRSHQAYNSGTDPDSDPARGNTIWPNNERPKYS